MEYFEQIDVAKKQKYLKPFNFYLPSYSFYYINSILHLIMPNKMPTLNYYYTIICFNEHFNLKIY